MSNVTYTPEEVASILKISKFTVYEMIKRGDLSAYRIGRKFRIESADLENYIRRSKGDCSTSSSGNTINLPLSGDAPPSGPDGREKTTDTHPAFPGSTLPDQSLVICGQDIILDILTRHLHKQFPQVLFLRQYSGSLDGLIALYRGQANVVTTHLWDSDTNEYNIPYVRRLLPGHPACIINLVYRMEGFYVAKGNPRKIFTWSDLGRSDIRFVNRERGSGARVLLDEQLRLAHIPHHSVRGYEDEEMSHMAVASRVARGEADVGLGIEKAAMQVSSLDFVPLHKERYDLVIRKEDLVKPHFQALLSILNSEVFHNEVAGIGGYDITDMGKIMGEV
ncbi:helix-turn-helix transcriptional regulator [Desulfitobacterium sp. PCE1]|uniref:substrate-binding domain-containing protein n=1 Tax=Desulfitobacterium sp. PCE1 TaxID=146907 RepID=UPI00036CC5B8|nr:helix-turn-helix transcriptional regulator [Desulfitobacterium sp. PCE1]